jgi:hypothetical protein
MTDKPFHACLRQQVTLSVFVDRWMRKGEVNGGIHKRLMAEFLAKLKSD